MIFNTGSVVFWNVDDHVRNVLIDDIIKFTYNEKRKMVSRNGYKNKLCDHGKYKNEIIKERETRLYIFNDGITEETKIAPDATLTDIANDQNLIAMFPEPRTETNREEQKKYQYAISLAMGESVRGLFFKNVMKLAERAEK